MYNMGDFYSELIFVNFFTETMIDLVAVAETDPIDLNIKNNYCNIVTHVYYIIIYKLCLSHNLHYTPQTFVCYILY